MQLSKSIPRTAAVSRRTACPSRHVIARRGAPAATAAPAKVVTAVKELSKEQIEAALKYGLIASCAYSDKDDEVTARFNSSRYSELKNAPIKRVTAKGTLWTTPLPNLKAATDTNVLCTRLPSSNGGGDEMVIAFRGTETKGMGASSDILTDLFALQTYIGEMKGVPVDRHPKEIKIHRGFLKSFNDVVTANADGKFDAMSDVRDELMGKGVIPQRVVVCGHSLGAALATLGAFWLKSIMPSVDVRCYAFASPRVGNKEWVTLFDSTVDACYRFTHKNDVVPAVPASAAWSHVNNPVLLVEPEKGTFDLPVPKVLPGGAKYTAVLADRPRKGVYASVGDHDMGLYLKALEEALKTK